jgi:hypothetical protein
MGDAGDWDLQEMTSLALGSSRRRRKFSVVVMSGEIPLGWAESLASCWA